MDMTNSGFWKLRMGLCFDTDRNQTLTSAAGSPYMAWVYKVRPGGQIRPGDEFYAARGFILELYFERPAQQYGTFLH